LPHLHNHWWICVYSSNFWDFSKILLLSKPEKAVLFAIAIFILQHWKVTKRELGFKKKKKDKLKRNRYPFQISSKFPEFAENRVQKIECHKIYEKQAFHLQMKKLGISVIIQNMGKPQEDLYERCGFISSWHKNRTKRNTEWKQFLGNYFRIWCWSADFA
jgi:hypothetical protein